MSHPRISLALEPQGLQLGEGTVGVFGPRIDTDLSDLPKAQCQLITGFKPDYDFFAARGYQCQTAPEGAFAASIVFLPRAKKLAYALIAQAVALTNGPVLVDGQKTDGVDSVMKALRKRAPLMGTISKAHGKLFWFEAPLDLQDWAAPAHQQIEEGFVTAPGVFSADGIDPASRLLLDALPAKPGKLLADFGAGWGYLSRHLLTLDKVKSVDLVEADHAALCCARQNVQDERATFHWADATQWRSPRKLDAVIMNPPFHTGRAAEPSLGQAFIASAAANLAPNGDLWLVANRHLPYETPLARFFMDVKEIAGDNRFKVLHAARVLRSPR